jgi:hypothetical protein
MKGIKQKLILAALGSLLLISNVSAAVSTYLAPQTYTDWDIWILSGLIALGMFALSLNPPRSIADCEIDAIISVLAWVPAGFCAFASFNVGKIMSAEKVVVSTYPVVGLLMIVFTFVCIANTFRIVAQHGALRGEQENAPKLENLYE